MGYMIFLASVYYQIVNNKSYEDGKTIGLPFAIKNIET